MRTHANEELYISSPLMCTFKQDYIKQHKSLQIWTESRQFFKQSSLPFIHITSKTINLTIKWYEIMEIPCAPLLMRKNGKGMTLWFFGKCNRCSNARILRRKYLVVGMCKEFHKWHSCFVYSWEEKKTNNAAKTLRNSYYWYRKINYISYISSLL